MSTRPYDITSAYNPGYMGYQGYQGSYISAGGYGAAMGPDYMTSPGCGPPYQLSSKGPGQPTSLSEK